ncbi:MAG: type I glyceraldehyde-3-phosphate dehydrogenase [Proteobacteria bacterium]|jgi:glyceraldehyde 3-phosphate dehydrogenase|nr:type I glyceraldehyde-3-phosphate dehydrogenase [Pseudomonadota bacterium]NCX10864.1 type I glyceraldehyde-3-phosphate dehydrogenase [Pseudomonadota bacterium]NCX34394.1 type I glyceraldehyde-3-phosphate dehydrogenase [Pseudomonadota bacterium]
MKIAINGFGRIGKNITRHLIDAGYLNNQGGDLELVAINDLGKIESNAHLLKYDSIHGAIQNSIKVDNDELIIDSSSIKYFSERNPEDLPWGDLDIDIVFECTGIFTSRDAASSHIKAGAKKVLISAPAQNPDKTIVYGVNHKQLTSDDIIISNASCTTNCLAPLAQIINDNYVIKSGLVNTVHASTNDQSLLDVAHSDLYRARAASASIIPSKTGAAKAIGLVIPELDGKLNGMATRVPTLNVSMLDFTFETEKNFTIDQLVETIKVAANKDYKDILSVCDLPLVSTDFNHNPSSSIFDSNHLYQIGNQTKILAWYDNEWGFSKRMIDLSKYIKEISSISFKETA